jgi:hypothetical protein
VLSVREAGAEGTDVVAGDTVVAAAHRRPDSLRDYVGKRLPLKVIEADQRRGRLIFFGEGRRAASQAQAQGTGCRRRFTAPATVCVCPSPG